MIQIKFDISKEVINLESGNFYNLVIEHKQFFLTFAEFLFFDLSKEPGFRIFKNNSLVEAENIGHPMSNVLDLDLNSKKNLNALNKILKKTYYDSLGEDLKQIKEKAKLIVQNIALDLDISLSMNEEIKTDDLFKILDVKFSDEKETFLERFINYIVVINELQEKQIFFTLHLKEYFSKEDIETIVKELSYKEIILFNIETSDFYEKSTNEKTIIVDKDYCLLI